MFFLLLQYLVVLDFKSKKRTGDKSDNYFFLEREIFPIFSTYFLSMYHRS